MKKIFYSIGRPKNERERLELDFRDGLSRSVEERIDLGFIPLKLSLIDEKPYRVFATMRKYRRWASRDLPMWLGYYIEDD